MFLDPIEITGEIIESISLEVWNQKNNGANWIAAITIKTPKGSLTIAVNPDLDELIIKPTTEAKYSSPNNPESSVIGVEDVGSLLDLINKKVVWLWRLTNNQGYNDGYQIEVTNGQDPILIQFMAVGSQINIYRLLKS